MAKENPRNPSDLPASPARAQETTAAGSGSRKGLDHELHLRSRELAERIKELGVIHSVSTLFETKIVDLTEVFQKIVNVLPSAWQYPELACARISMKNRDYRSSSYREPICLIQEDILAVGEKIGTLEVGYFEPLPDGSEPDFLVEEKGLLTIVARRLAEAYSLKESQLQLATYQQHLRSLASELTLTEERERRRLALHLHDSIGQGLALAKLKLETLRHVLPEAFKERVGDVLTLVQQIIAEARSITAEISPPILYELSFYQAIVWLCDHFKKQFGMTIEVVGADQNFLLGEGVRVMLFRSIQELLTNAVKHASATEVRVCLEREEHAVHVCIEDNGVGFGPEQQNRYPSASGGFGIFSIRERLAHLGGRLTIESSPGKGARVHLWVPAAERTVV
ncbi:MAG: sensor histidine kinase [candidate division Zixibacteria bacterium]|jgi:signal transduction histidine kinase|nr:sensor histidine kinase [candidate division Zixibacteria bacterium]